MNSSIKKKCHIFVSITYTTLIVIYPEVNENTVANVSLHCTAANLMMIKFNSGMYIIEQNVSENVWRLVNVINGNMIMFTNLTAGTNYRYRFYKLIKNGILRAETTDSFSTYEVDYEPLAVQNISLLKLEVDEKNGDHLHADIAFEAATDRSCDYYILLWSEEHNLKDYDLRKVRVFQFSIGQLEFNTNNTVHILSVNEVGAKMSPRTAMVIYTPPCVDYYNLTICAPDNVKGLQTEHIYRYGEFYDLNITWDKPNLEPDNYTIEVQRKEEYDLLTKIVPGNRTDVIFSNVKLDSYYEVSICAESLGGMSGITSILRRVAVVNEFSNKVMIVTIVVITGVVLFIGVIYFQCYKRRNKHFTMECTHFENFGQKNQAIETDMKLLHTDYDTEFNCSRLVHDKYELCPKLLKLNHVIGSGAYGVVRLGSLQDKFGNSTDVAVKMLKENPSVQDIKNFHKEILIMKFAGHHPNIASLIGCCFLYNKPVLVVEYCCKGDLQTYLRTIWQNMIGIAFTHGEPFGRDVNSFTDSGIDHSSNNSAGNGPNYQNVNVIVNRLYDIQQDVARCTETVSALDLLNFARQIVTGMEFLSSSRIIHRDLAARNILVCAGAIVKISDFGLSRDVYQENLYRKQGNGKLPLKWMAIEALTHQIYTTQSDVWSFGILLWEIVTMGAHPYPDVSMNAILKFLKSGYRMGRPFNCSVELYDIMLSCWNVIPQSRPTFTQLGERLDTLICDQSDNEYLIIDKILCDDQDQYRIIEE
ncbi:tyrosine-protein kinase receptor torso-like isoform X3 [Nomia melanderi]|uniref:tyrosine-protein kinase receptor torso-like isoform X3 n=1 Tax=Nomia melanderi TaxID=2448451 RepID=UPI003FCCF6B9